MVNGPGGSTSVADIERLDDEELRQRLEALRLPTTGITAVLVERLSNAMQRLQEDKDGNKTRPDGVQNDGKDGKGTEGGKGSLNIEKMLVDDLRAELAKRGLSTKGPKPELKERLKRALETSEDEESTEEEIRDSDIDEMRTAELRKELTKRGLEVKGGKALLRGRLRRALKKDDELSEESSDSECESDQVIRNAVAQHRNVEQVTIVKGQTITFKDVEDSLEKFSGDAGENIRRWLLSFEETADTAGWSDAQRVIFSKRLLKGSAKLFANYECHAKTWSKLKKLLIAEFAKTTNSRHVHKQLALAEKKKDENYQAYVYRMLEIASHTEIETEATVQYIVDGIKDDEANKSVLYGATTIKELRKRFQLYEIQKSNSARYRSTGKSSSSDRQKKSTADGKTEGEKTKRCYNCGSKEHLSKDCPDKAKGKKCFICREFGHVSSECPNKDAKADSGKPKTKARVDALGASDKKTYKEVNILGHTINAVIDSGSDLHIARASLYVRLGAPPLQTKTIAFAGVGSANVRTLGRFSAEVEIDGIKFHFNIDVVPDDYVGHDLLIGGELSDYAEVRLRNRCATLTRTEDPEVTTEVDDGEAAAILNINVQEETEDEADVTTKHIKDETIKEEVKSLVEDYEPRKTEETNVKMKIVVKDEVPVFQNPRRLSADQRKIVNDIVEGWIRDGIVRASSSEYASPIVLVQKKNAQWRLCVDYRMINRKMLRDRNPLPLIEDQLDRLQDAEYFCTLDLKDGFFHVPVDDSSIKYTAFVTPDGQYEFLKVPFGLCNSPAVFQRYVRAVFKTLIAGGVVLTYLDDLIIPARTEAEGLEKLRKVLETASRYGLVINWGKCKLLVTQVDYLGYIVEKGRIRPSTEKTKAVAKFPKPKTVKQIQSFLGLTGYFRKFISQYAIVARPLSNLLRDGVRFHFGPEQEEAFEKLKTALIEQPILKLYRTEAETELHTDACKGGLGAALMQKDSEDGRFHPVYFASWKTTPTEERYTSFELEVLAIIKALKRFRVYLLGIPFKIATDCQAFVQTMKKKDMCLRVAHWALMLEHYQYTIEHRAGTAMRHVDALSRNPVQVMCLQVGRGGLIERIQRAQQEDPEVRKIMETIQTKPNDRFKLSPHNILYHDQDGEELLVVPASMQQEVIKVTHERGHFAWDKVEHSLKQQFWFPRMREKINKVIRNCVQCILAEKKKGRVEGFLNPIEKGDAPLDTYHIDHLGPMPSTKKSYCHLFAVVDAFTKFVWLYPTRSTTADEVVKRLRRQAVTFGNPRRIISDRGTAFTSKAFGQYCQDENIVHALITTGVPRGNGQVERVNRTIIPVLTKLSMPKPLEWYKHVDKVQQAINATKNRSTGRTPFELLIGIQMKLKDDLELRRLIDDEIIAVFEENRCKTREDAKENLLKVQEENKRTFNKKRKAPRPYREQELVAIKRTQFGPGLKVYTPYLGPYRVTRVLKNDRYMVEKVGEHEGPYHTSSAADFMKPWSDVFDFSTGQDDPDDDAMGGLEDETCDQDGRL